MSLFTQNWSFNSTHLCLGLTTGSLHLRTWGPLKTHHCALKKRKRGASVLYFKSWQISQSILFFTTHTVHKNCVPPCFCNSCVWQTIGCWSELDWRAFQYWPVFFQGPFPLEAEGWAAQLVFAVCTHGQNFLQITHLYASPQRLNLLWKILIKRCNWQTSMPQILLR